MRYQRARKKFAPVGLAILQGAVLVIACDIVCTARVVAADASSMTLQVYRQDLALALQKNSSPRDWALGSQLLETQPGSGALRERGLILQRAAKAAPRDRLVQTLWTNTPLETRHCRAAQQCTDHWLALAHLDPDNGVAWLAPIDHAWKRHDVRGTDAALRRMAGSERYNEHLGEAIAAWRDIFRRYPPPLPHVLPRYGANTSTDVGDELDLTFNEAVATVTPPVASLVDACRKASNPHADPGRFENCGKIARVMMGRAQTLLDRLIGVTVLRASQAGKAADIGMIRAVTWQYEQYQPIEAALSSSAISKQNHLDVIQSTDSEIQIALYELRSAGILLTPPAGWKQTINGKQIEPLDDLPGQRP